MTGNTSDPTATSATETETFLPPDRRPTEHESAAHTAGPSAPPPLSAPAAKDPVPQRPAQAVLEKLFVFYPQLFGATFLPLKLGVFQELLARHADVFQRDTLKAALGIHTRSTRYLQAVAAGRPRHDLEGQAVEPVAPEHVFWALVELFRRRQARSSEDLRPKLRRQLIAAFEASGVAREDYRLRVQTRDAEAATLLEEALAEHDQQLAREEALLKAFDGSGKTLDEFCDMYGVDKRGVMAALGRAGRTQAPAKRG